MKLDDSETEDQVRDYEKVVRRIESLTGVDRSLARLGIVEGYPIYCVNIYRDDSLPTIFVNGGTHGDEPAGVEAALAFLESDQASWLNQFQFCVIPCLNPHGYVHNNRANAQGVDINWAYLETDVPEIVLIRNFVCGKRFQAVIDLHEDWESSGYYLYELFRGRKPVGKLIADRVSGACPLNEDEEIEGEKASHGVIHPDLEVGRRKRREGIPIGLFVDGFTDYLVTLETPTDQDLNIRIRSHLVAIETILGEHSRGASSGSPGVRKSA